MFQTHKKDRDDSKPDGLVASSLSVVGEFEKVDSFEDFELWLESSLEELTSRFSDFETDKSVCKFFSR